MNDIVYVDSLRRKVYCHESKGMYISPSCLKRRAVPQGSIHVARVHRAVTTCTAMSSTLVLVAYPVTAAVVVSFGVFALTVGYFHFRRHGKDSTEFFLTARNSAGLFRIAFSMYAGGVGSWALFSAPSYAYTAGSEKPWRCPVL